jgi:hypothetical protein
VSASAGSVPAIAGIREAEEAGAARDPRWRPPRPWGEMLKFIEQQILTPQYVPNEYWSIKVNTELTLADNHFGMSPAFGGGAARSARVSRPRSGALRGRVTELKKFAY